MEDLGASEGRESCLSFTSPKTIFKAVADGKHFRGFHEGPARIFQFRLVFYYWVFFFLAAWGSVERRGARVGAH